MDLNQMAQLGEFVGGMGVIATFAYLAIQLRQNTQQLRQGNELAQSAAELEVGRLNSDWMKVGFTDNSFNVFWEKGFFEPEALAPEERAKFLWLFNSWSHVVQSLYRQFQRGLLPAASWEPMIATLVASIRQSTILEEWWDSNVNYLAEDFRAYVDDQIKNRPEFAWRPYRFSGRLASPRD